jgi:membrane fusion protein (multidrug efflux system)
LTAKVVSPVTAVHVDLGNVVRKGDLLVELSDQLYRANLDTARAQYVHARAQRQRMETLLKQNFAALVDVEKARTDEATARQAVVQAEIDLANTTVKSPAPAVVMERTINPGEITKLDQEMLKLGVLDPVMMVAEVSEDKGGSVHLGMQAEVGTDAFPGETFTGQVVKVEATVNEATRTFGAYIQIANRDLRLKQGVTGYARLENDRMALAIPSTALMNPVGDRAAVFVIAPDGRAHLREVRRGLMVAGMTELLDGVQEGEKVVTAGLPELRDNDQVRPNQEAPWNKQ